ncbi:MAG: 30S ribosomal protein S24e [Nitrososphaerota archaeon]|nr:30S ribosomal protein S24e [Candidatus Bathyarchaeota archaeon]MDW8048236.1 30S ribosomal protein S24e [Nitrososphaerota archaeon]
MKVSIIDQSRNELLKRLEVKFQVEHPNDGTPSRLEVREKIANKLGIDVERVYVRKMETKSGVRVAVGEAMIYDTVDQAKYVEPEHIILRNVKKKEEKVQ